MQLNAKYMFHNSAIRSGMERIIKQVAEARNKQPNISSTRMSASLGKINSAPASDERESDFVLPRDATVTLVKCCRLI